MASIENAVIRVVLLPGPQPHSLCQEWIGPPTWWARVAAFVGLACAAVAVSRPNADEQTIVFAGLLFGGLATIVWEISTSIFHLMRQIR